MSGQRSTKTKTFQRYEKFTTFDFERPRPRLSKFNFTQVPSHQIWTRSTSADAFWRAESDKHSLNKFCMSKSKDIGEKPFQSRVVSDSHVIYRHNVNWCFASSVRSDVTVRVRDGFRDVVRVRKRSKVPMISFLEASTFKDDKSKTVKVTW